MAEVLSEYLAEMSGRPFVYGADDCATMVIGWLDRLYGRRALDKWRGLYSDQAGCEAFIAELGGFESIATKFFAEHYDLARSGPGNGNPVFAFFKGVYAMGLRIDARSVALRTKAGLMITSRATVVAEWGAA